MKNNTGSNRSPFHCLALLLTLALAGPSGLAQDKPKEFSKAVIDIGIVAKDVEKSAKFYTEGIGLTEVKGFSVTGDMGRKIGLIDNQPANVRVFVLGEAEGSTKIKLMSFPQAPGKAADQSFIHSTYGYRYLTIFVASTDKALERLKKAGVKPIGETPFDLGNKNRLTTVRDPDGNFIELIGP
jgi:catechol 2,3-dioxygenase-like lactoylglutathione lyase family enzyme